MPAIQYKKNYAASLFFFIILFSAAHNAFCQESTVGGSAGDSVSGQEVVTKLNDAPRVSPSEIKRARRKVESEYILKRGDRIKVTIYPEDKYVRGGEVLVTEDGNVRIHTLGKVQVADKLIVDAENEITGALEDYFVDPAVVIELMQSEERKVVVLGEVRKPGTYSFPMGKNRFTLMEAIALSGGFSDIANIKKITITNKMDNEDGNSDRRRANAEAILKGEEEDIPLKPNDIINVSESFF